MQPPLDNDEGATTQIKPYSLTQARSATYDLAPYPLITVDEEGEVLDFNRAALVLSQRFGTQAVEVLLPENHKQIAAEALCSNRKITERSKVQSEDFEWSVVSDQLRSRVHFFGTQVTAWVEQLEREFRRSQHDALTGIYNRLYFEEALDQAIENAKSKKGKHYRTAVMYLDIDHFKMVNDILGHGIGDLVLKETATAIQSTIRQDIVARIGGEEFGVILTFYKLSDTSLMKDRIIRVYEAVAHRFSRPFEIVCDSLEQLKKIEAKVEAQPNLPLAIEFFPEGLYIKLWITLSAGTAIYRKKESRKSILQRADSALYESKEGGRNRHTFAPN